MIDWFAAPALITLRDQINEMFPDRDKGSDGFIGDASHVKEPGGSDHNPDPTGMVCAVDITNDPAHGVNIDSLTDILYASHDHRIKYIIANRLITTPSGTGSGDYGPWVHYYGISAHTEHFHLSILGGKYGNDASKWAGFDIKEKDVLTVNEILMGQLEAHLPDGTTESHSLSEWVTVMAVRVANLTASVGTHADANANAQRLMDLETLVKKIVEKVGA